MYVLYDFLSVDSSQPPLDGFPATELYRIDCPLSIFSIGKVLSTIQNALCHNDFLHFAHVQYSIILRKSNRNGITWKSSRING